MLHRSDVDWERQGFDDEALDELAELGLRTFHSMLVDPGSRHVTASPCAGSSRAGWDPPSSTRG